MRRLHFPRLKALILVIVIASIYAVLTHGAEPEAPSTINVGQSGRLEIVTTGSAVTAQAGNVTALVIDNTFATSAWQGYYGNVTGTVVLQDAGGDNLYSWALNNPAGEVYAANHSVVIWNDVRCLNFTGNTTEVWHNVTTVEDDYKINDTDLDGVNETFNATYDDGGTGFFAGNVHITDDDACPMTYSYVNGASQATSFREVILHDNNTLVWTALLENNVDGFQSGAGDTHDFQMLVPIDGHDNINSTRTYYFFVELE